MAPARIQCRGDSESRSNEAPSDQPLLRGRVIHVWACVAVAVRAGVCGGKACAELLGACGV